MDANHKRIPASAVREICGGVSDMWLWRRLNDPNSGFPKPAYIGRRRYWRKADILDWWDRRDPEAGATQPDGASA